jgi:hypothetical protein
MTTEGKYHEFNSCGCQNSSKHDNYILRERAAVSSIDEVEDDEKKRCDGPVQEKIKKILRGNVIVQNTESHENDRPGHESKRPPGLYLFVKLLLNKALSIQLCSLLVKGVHI